MHVRDHAQSIAPVGCGAERKRRTTEMTRRSKPAARRKLLGRGHLGAYLFALAAAALVFAVAGCGSSGSNSSSSASTDSGNSGETANASSSSSSCAKEATAAVEAAEASPTAPIPTEAVDAAKLAGKPIWYINEQPNEVDDKQAEAFVEAGKAAGLEVESVSAQGKLPMVGQEIQQAVTQHAGAIVLLGVDQTAAKSAFEEAVAAGIPVITTAPGSEVEGLTRAPIPAYEEFGKIMADQALASTNCETKALMYSTALYPVIADLQEATKKEFERLCPECSLEINEVEPEQIAELRTQISTDLSRAPDTNFIISAYDALAQSLVPGMQASGKDIPVVSADGDEANIEYVSEGTQVSDVSREPYEYSGYQQLDVTMRVMAGQKLDQADGSPPGRLISKKVIEESPEGEFFPGYKGFQAKFEKAWGVG